MARRTSQLSDKIDINMTPMIDVVFQLMSFFMCSLKIVAPEGDFDIRMPLGRSASNVVDEQRRNGVDPEGKRRNFILCISLGGMVALEWMRQFEGDVDGAVRTLDEYSAQSDRYGLAEI